MGGICWYNESKNQNQIVFPAILSKTNLPYKNMERPTNQDTFDVAVLIQYHNHGR